MMGYVMSDKKVDSPFGVFFEGVPVEILAAAALVLEKFVEMGLYRHFSFCTSWFRFGIDSDWFQDAGSGDSGLYDKVYFDRLSVTLQDGCANFSVRGVHGDTYYFGDIGFCEPNFADVVYERCMEVARIVDEEWADGKKLSNARG